MEIDVKYHVGDIVLPEREAFKKIPNMCWSCEYSRQPHVVVRTAITDNGLVTQTNRDCPEHKGIFCTRHSTYHGSYIGLKRTGTPMIGSEMGGWDWFGIDDPNIVKLY